MCILFMSLLISLFIGGLAGLLAGMIRKGHGFGFFGNIVIGLVGGFVGNFVFSLFGIQDTNFIGSILVSTIGAVILLYGIGQFNKEV
jgi:uncharacterized membrane protein YeaQ/YmgE (transglycosylase-associated protein family)